MIRTIASPIGNVTRHGFLDVLICVVVALLSFGLCLLYGFSLEDPMQYAAPNQLNVLYPSVFVAAGHGLSRTSVDAVPGLSSFFFGETQHFDLSLVPDELETSPISTALELTHIYFILAVGWFWRLLGVSINTLLIFSAFMYAISACALYGLFRLGLSRLGSLLGALLVCASPAMLYMSPVFRDFAKAPFLFLFLFLASVLLRRPLSRRRLIFVCAFMGGLLGVGLGFRQDFLICLPPALASIIIFPGHSVSRAGKSMAVLLFCAFFMFAAFPVIRGMIREGNQATAHIFFQGLAPDVEAGLAFEGASYEHPKWGDASVFAQVNTYARRHGVTESMVNPHSGEYMAAHGDPHAPLMVDPGLYYNGTRFATAASALMLEIVHVFPADLVARAWRAVVALFDMPYDMYKEVMGDRTSPAPVLLAAEIHAQHPPPEAHFPGWFEILLNVQGGIAWFISRYGVICTMLVLLIVGAYRLPLALYLTGMMLWFGGYPSLLYEYRHSFYLIFIPIWVMAICVEHPLRYLYRVVRNRHTAVVPPGSLFKTRGRGACRSLAYPGLMLLLLLLPLGVLRMWQKTQVHGLARQLEQTSLVPVPLQATDDGTRTIYSPVDTLPGLVQAEALPAGETAWEFVAVEFFTHGEDIPLSLIYDQEVHLHNFSRQITLKGAADGNVGRVTYYFPIYETLLIHSAAFLEQYMRTIKIETWLHQMDDAAPLEEQQWWGRGRFQGISFPPEFRKYFAGFYRVSDIEHLRILPFFELPEAAQFLRPYKTGPWERNVWRLAGTISSHLQRYSPETDEVLVTGEYDYGDPREIAFYAAESDLLHLDKTQLSHQWPVSFPGPLLGDISPNTYIDTWRQRMCNVPGLNAIAAEDLARVGVAWHDQGREDAGRLALDAAIELKDDIALYRVLLAQMLLSDDKPDAALEQFQRAMLLNPFLPESAEVVEDIYRQRHDYRGLAAFWQTIFDSHPEQWFAGMRAGAAHELNTDIDAAVAVYQQVHKAHPDHSDTAIALARCHGFLGNMDRTTTLLIETVRSHPEKSMLVGTTALMLGDRYREKAEWNFAEKAYGLAARYMPEDAQLFMFLGDAQYHLGKMDEAKRSFEQALALASGDRGALAPLIQERLNALP